MLPNIPIIWVISRHPTIEMFPSLLTIGDISDTITMWKLPHIPTIKKVTNIPTIYAREKNSMSSYFFHIKLTIPSAYCVTHTPSAYCVTHTDYFHAPLNAPLSRYAVVQITCFFVVFQPMQKLSCLYQGVTSSCCILHPILEHDKNSEAYSSTGYSENIYSMIGHIMCYRYIESFNMDWYQCTLLPSPLCGILNNA